MGHGKGGPYTQQELLNGVVGCLTPLRSRRRVDPAVWVLCPTCNATGWVPARDRGADIGVQCSTCHGGRLIKER